MNDRRSAAQIDHVVINVRTQMDDAVERFARLGFCLSDRGYHTLGSINHLMVLQTDYLELIGVPEQGQNGEPVARAGVSDAPVGINGLVFKTSDVDRTHAHLRDIGMAGDAPIAFSRPVDTPDGQRDARFRTVHVAPGIFSAGRVYFCEHATPELVWQADRQRHPNAARRIAQLVVVSDDPAGLAHCFGRLLQTDPIAAGRLAWRIVCDGAALLIVDRDGYGERYGALATTSRGGDSFFGALVLGADDLQAVRDAVTGQDVPLLAEATRIVVREARFDTVIEFGRAD